VEVAQDSISYYCDHVAGKTLDDYSSTYEHQMMLIKKIAPVQANARILEVGCGTGWFTVLARRAGFDAVGMDLAERVVRFAARERAAEGGVKAHFLSADAEALPFDDGHFDVLIANSVLEHVPEWRTFLKEVHRVLVPGGVALLGTGNRCYPISGEIDFPLYPWLPFGLQKRIAVAKRGPDILKTNHIAWNNFTHRSLRRALIASGFGHVHDLVDVTEPDDVRTERRRQAARVVLPIAKRFRLVRWLLFWSFSSTVFLVQK
jgi:SAM-dependent methyltransferase